MKKVTVASDSFKGSLTSRQVAEAVCNGVRDIYPDCEEVKVNVADGGEGTVDALTEMLGGVRIETVVSDPLGRPVTAVYGIIDGGRTAVIEMSAASGLPLLSVEERNPLLTSTYGTGEMILDALRRGCRKFLVGIGGSATNDAGTGMLSALGFRFLDVSGNALPGKGGILSEVASIDASGVFPEVLESEFVVACDVDNPFCGPSGAAYVFAPQKGADAETVRVLDAGMGSFAGIILGHSGIDVTEYPGAGAAGGLGGAFKAFLNAELCPGIEMVLDAVRFSEMARGSDLVITGEGRIDSQTLRGKTPAGVFRRAHSLGIPVLAIGGCVEMSEEMENFGFRDIVQVTPEGMPLEQAMREDVASSNIRTAVSAYLKRSLPVQE